MVLAREWTRLLAGLGTRSGAALCLALGGDGGLVRGVEIAKLRGDAVELLR
jgi:hypothetical protein